MRWQGGRESDNVEDQRGSSFGGPPVMLGGGGMLIVLILALLFGVDPLALLQQVNQGPPQPGARHKLLQRRCQGPRGVAVERHVQARTRRDLGEAPVPHGDDARAKRQGPRQRSGRLPPAADRALPAADFRV